MNKVLPVNKPVGITSYDVIRKLKKQYPGQKIGHAGTLDPLADGILICLIGKYATQRQSEFMDVSKDYECSVLFGVGTDTYDVLGLITDTKEYVPSAMMDQLPAIIKKYIGKIDQPVPPFSAVKIQGKPLYRWYLDGKISEVEIPIKEVEVESLDIVSYKIVTTDELKNKIVTLIENVKSGFRQKEVLSKWDEFFKTTNQKEFGILTLKASVSKGTYVRAIANAIGVDLGVNACTITITRTRVGDYSL